MTASTALPYALHLAPVDHSAPVFLGLGLGLVVMMPIEPAKFSLAGSPVSMSTNNMAERDITAGTAPPKARRLDPIMEVAAFLAQLRRLHLSGSQYKAGDLVFDFFEERFERDGNELGVCDEVLQSITHPEQLSDTILVAILAVTMPARAHLPSRVEFLQRVRAYLTLANGSDEAEIIAEAYK